MLQKTPASNDSKSVWEQSHEGSNPSRCASSSQATYRLRRAFSFHCKARPALILLLLASKSNPLTLGFDLVFGADLWVAASFSTTIVMPPRTSYRSRRLFCKRHLSLICRGSHPNHNRVAGLWFDFRVRFRGVAFRQGMENNRE